MTQEQISRLKCTRKKRYDKYWVNVFRYGRKVVAEIWEPNEVIGLKYDLAVPVGGGYGLHSKHDTFPEAVEKMGDFLESIHVK